MIQIKLTDEGNRYQEIYAKYPSRVLKIFIHDVTSERAIVEDRRQRERDASDSYYNTIRKFLVKEESHLLRRSNTGTHAAMDAMTHTEIPQEQQAALDPDVPQATKEELFKQRLERVTQGMPEGLFTLFKNSSRLLSVSDRTTCVFRGDTNLSGQDDVLNMALSSPVEKT